MTREKDKMPLEYFRQWIQEMRTKDNCFLEHKDEDEKCYGLYGGDSWSENHCYKCMDCPHLLLASTTSLLT